MTTTPSWQTLSAAHRERQKRAIPAEWTLEPDRIEQLKHVGTKVEGRLIEADVVRESGLLTDAELAITQDFTAAELLEKMSSRDLTSLQVVEAFGKRAALAQQLASCSSGYFSRMSVTNSGADIMLDRNVLCGGHGKSTNA
jgi:amidase